MNALKQAGWTPARLIDTTEAEDVYERAGYSVFDLGKEFLGRFGGLEIEFVRYGELDRIWFLAARTVEFTDPLWVDDYSNRAGMPLLPVGYGLNDHLMILVASDGSVYGGFDDFFQRFGDDVPAAIEAIMQEQVSE